MGRVRIELGNRRRSLVADSTELSIMSPHGLRSERNTRKAALLNSGGFPNRRTAMGILAHQDRPRSAFGFWISG